MPRRLKANSADGTDARYLRCDKPMLLLLLLLNPLIAGVSTYSKRARIVGRSHLLKSSEIFSAWQCLPFVTQAFCPTGR